MTKLTIIIPSKNIEYLRNCIASILRAKTAIKYEILVIHNGNNEAINSYTDGYNLKQYIYNRQFNFSEANNKAVELTQTEFILFLNDDTEILSNYWLDNMINSYSKDTGAIGATLLYKNGDIQSIGDSVGLSKYWHGSVIAWNNKTIVSQNTYRVDSVTAACLLIKRSVFIEIEGFDERYKLGFGDVDLGIKLMKKGYTNIVVPSIYILHLEYGTRVLTNDGSSELLNTKWNTYIFKLKLKLKLQSIYTNLTKR